MNPQSLFLNSNRAGMRKDKENFLKQLREMGRSEKTVKAFASVEQELFIPRTVNMQYYRMKAVPAGFGEKTDDPALLSEMIDILSPAGNWRLLEIGGGSGYSTAVLSTMVKEVVSIEYNEGLASMARTNLIDNGFFNIRSFAGDGSRIAFEMGSFDGIIIHAACSQRPMGILSALRNGCCAVFPMGPSFQQQITCFRNNPVSDEVDSYKNCTFHGYCSVSSIRGEYGWADRPDIPDIPEEVLHSGK